MRAERSRAEALGTGRAAATARSLYLRWLELRHGRRGVPWSLHGEPFRIDPRVRHLLPSSAEPALFAYLHRAIRPGDVIVDAGGFLGAYPIVEARWAGPSGRVVTFEPSPRSAAVARAHFEMNPEGSRITLIEAAVGDRAGTALLASHDEPYRNQILVEQPEGWYHSDAAEASYHDEPKGSYHTVRVTTIDKVCCDLAIRPTLIRMDVQGAEIAALEGAREIIRTGRGTLRIVVEMHPQLWQSFGVTPQSARDRLEALGVGARPLEGNDPFAADGHAILEYI
ncbi:MAG TPA: FkbM family methyltransferase [Vicinamibacterales bacterium]|jgi:FkbM family methyltransferase|nr:FkbM family methyltransferase [Vicinamibacterales bacterium]